VHAVESRKFSVVVVTRNRFHILRELLESLVDLRKGGLEIFVVDNASGDGTSQEVKAKFPRVTVISLESNHGAVARNFGFQKAGGDIIVTLDDDVTGLTETELTVIERYFNENPNLAALNFKVLDDRTGSIANWCHPYKPEEFSDKYFQTCEISEGAVALRRSVLEETGYYPESFFISNEGADLVCRMLNRGYEIGFAPDVDVFHKYCEEAREPWRRYYYDTRNHFWLAIRNFRFGYGIKYVLTKVGIMLVYSLRDGYFRYWIKGVVDALRGVRVMFQTRHPLTASAERRLIEIQSHKPGIFYMLRERLAHRQVKI
jgi:GT2 family glycosyltransferase